VWVQEVETSSEWMPEAYVCEYATRRLENAAARHNVWGFTRWCSHDIDPAMKGFLSLEYTLGVLDQQNPVKPLGRTLSTLADEWRKNPWRKNPPAVISRSVALVIPDKGLSKKGQSLSQEQRDRRADRGRGAITRNQHSSTNSIERRQLRHQDQCNNEF
jgi:hypothetical protein